MAYGAASVLTAGDTYGIVWRPDPGAADLLPSLPTTPSGTAGCVVYKVRAWVGAGTRQRVPA